ncbi:GNAT family N-acetyltransferase [Streptococcus oralis]|uniref:Acetyltransferase, GNAT family n=1 Tax=Streptococcus oralis TaxID=1303 RepID=A0A139QSG5_STROR|nr:GNAT family protein [Streptococcus oralis]KXU05479.1 Acetyltransferase, GNAT family [Streptococcus oralis]
MPVNEYGQMIGESVVGHTSGKLPAIDFLEGRYARIEALSVEKHAEDLLAVYGPDTPREMWTYLFQEPVADREELVSLLNQMLARKDRFFYAILDRETGKVLGTFSLMRIDQNNRVVEVGTVIFSPELRGTRIGTEAQYLLARYVFEELNYRRYEWKCDALNLPSRRAAERLGFVYEGTFRQAVVYKGRTRDTDWLSMIDKDWARVKVRLEAWLAPENFDKNGRQYKSLREF